MSSSGSESKYSSYNSGYSAAATTTDATPPTTTASPPGGSYPSAQSVTLTCADNPGGSGCFKTYYTIDGTNPTTSSLVYSSAISISSNTTLKFFSVDNKGNTETPPKTATYTISTVSAAQPNLMPFKPDGWSDKIVVSTTTGTTTDSGSFTTSDTIYVDRAVINNGTADINTQYYTDLYLDGIKKVSWYSNPLKKGSRAYSNDSSLGTLSAGSHTIAIKTDATGVVAESDESDNEYSRTITVQGTAGTTDAAAPTTTASPPGGSYPSAQSVTLTCADNPGGSGCSKTYYTTDGTTPTTSSSVYSSAISISSPTTLNFFSVDNKGNTETPPKTATYTISTASAAQPNLTPYKPSGWSDKIVVSTSTGTNTDSGSFTTSDTIYVDWDVKNIGTADINTTFYTYLYVDGVYKKGWNTGSLTKDYHTPVPDYPLGTLSAGSHTIAIKTDATGVVAESNESDNEYSKTITVQGVAGTTDAAPPANTTASNFINGGASSTSSRSVTLSISATDDVGVAGYYASESSTTPSATATGWTPVASATSYSNSGASFTLSSGDGTKTVNVWFKDAAGKVSSPASDTINLDATAPTDGTLSATAGSQQVSLSWGGFSDSNGIASYSLVYSAASSPSSCGAGTSIYSGASTSYTHTGLADGTTYYYRVCAADNANNISLGATASATTQNASISVTSVSPTTATLNQSTTFTAYGSNLRSGMAFYIADCASVTDLGGSPTSWSWSCTPSNSAGSKQGVVKDAPVGTALYNFTVNVQDATPTVTSVSPTTATLNQSTTFTAYGSNLRSGMAFYIADCASVTDLGGSSTSWRWSCTPSYSTGSKQGVVKDAPYGTALYSFNVAVQ